MAKKNITDYDLLEFRLEMMSPKQVVGFIIKEGNRFGFEIRGTERGELVYNRALRACSTTEERKKEFKYYISLVDSLAINMSKDILNTLVRIYETSAEIEHLLDSMLKASFQVCNNNLILRAYYTGSEEYRLQHKERIETIIKKFEQQAKIYKKAYDIEIKRNKKGYYTINTSGADKIYTQVMEGYLFALKMTKTIEVAYKNFKKYFEVSQWSTPPILDYLLKVAKEDRNVGRRYDKNIIQEIFLKQKWSEEFGCIPLETFILLNSRYTDGLSPIYPTYEEVGYREDIAGTGKENNLYVYRYYEGR